MSVKAQETKVLGGTSRDCCQNIPGVGRKTSHKKLCSKCGCYTDFSMLRWETVPKSQNPTRNHVIWVKSIMCKWTRPFWGTDWRRSPKALPRPRQPLYAVPRFREPKSACRVTAFCEMLSQYPQSAFQGFSGGGWGVSSSLRPKPSASICPV